MTRKEAKIAKIDSAYMQQYDAQVARRNKRKKRLIRRLVLFSIVVLVAFGSLTTYHMKQRAVYAEKQAELKELEEKLTILKDEEENLKREVELLNDEEYVKQIARTNYFYSEEGEIIFKLPDDKASY